MQSAEAAVFGVPVKPSPVMIGRGTDSDYTLDTMSIAYALEKLLATRLKTFKIGTNGCERLVYGGRKTEQRTIRSTKVPVILPERPVSQFGSTDQFLQCGNSPSEQSSKEDISPYLHEFMGEAELQHS